MKKIAFFATTTLLLLPLLVSCSQTAPACSSESVKQHITEMALEQTRTELEKMRKDMEELNIDTKDLPGFEDIEKDAVFLVQNIMNEGRNEKTGSYRCSAELSIEFKGEKDVVDITYTAAPVEGQDVFDVSVDNLSPK